MGVARLLLLIPIGMKSGLGTRGCAHCGSWLVTLRSVASADDRYGGSVRPRGGQARCAVSGPGTVAKADVIARLCARARRSRPWSRPPDTARRPFSPGGPRPIRVRSPGSRSTAETTTRWCSCGRSRPRFTGSSPSRPTCSMRCPGQADPPGRRGSRVSAARWPRLSARWCWRSTICTLSPIRPVWTCSRSFPVRPGRLPDRDREQGRAGPAPRPLAGAGIGERGRRGGPPAGRAGGRVAACSCGCRARRRRGLRADRADGRMACRLVPGGAVDAGRGGSRWAPRASPAATGSCPSTSASSFCPGCRKRGAVPQVHLGAGAHVRRSLRRRARDDGVGADARDARAHERLRGASRPAGRVVPLPPPLRRAPQERARAHRARGGACAQRSCDGLVRRQRPARGGGRLRASSGRDGGRRRLDRRP